MKKELSPSLEMVACDVCGRTILKGERTEPYMLPDGSRRRVCELCIRRAESAGWLRESLHGDLPAAAPRAEPRRSVLGRLRRRQESAPAEAEPAPLEADDVYAGEPLEEPSPRGIPDQTPPPPAYEPAPPPRRPARPEAEAVAPAPAIREDAAYQPEAAAPTASPDEVRALDEALPVEDPLTDYTRDELGLDIDSRAARRDRRTRRRVRDPRHVRAVPTGAEAKVERALEIFNLSDYRRTIGGLIKTLGPPWVTARPHEGSTGEVTVVVAWELSWYQFRIDLGDADEPVAVADKGHEVDEIDADLRRWNATATDDGALESSVPAA
jgi:hypothetical protein